MSTKLMHCKPYVSQIADTGNFSRKTIANVFRLIYIMVLIYLICSIPKALTLKHRGRKDGWPTLHLHIKLSRTRKAVTFYAD